MKQENMVIRFTPQDKQGLLDLFEGHIQRYAKPGVWRAYRENGQVVIEILNDSDEQHSS